MKGKVKAYWKDIAGYDGFYMVSNLGDVKSLNRIILNSVGSGTRMFKGRFLKRGIGSHERQ